MFDWLPQRFRPTRQGLLDNHLTNVTWTFGGMILSSVFGWIAAPTSDREWVFLSLKIFLLLCAGWVLIAVGRYFWNGSQKQGDGTGTLFPTAADGGASVPQTQAMPAPSEEAVEIAVRGDWLNTAFTFSHLGQRNGTPLYGEDAAITLTAKDYLENVRVQIVATAVAPPQRAELWHRGVFEGAITTGMTETIRIFQRTFQYRPIAIRNEGGAGHYHTQSRHEGEIFVFPDGPSSTTMPQTGIDFQITIHHRRGTIRGFMTIDTQNAIAPRSRLLNERNLKIATDYSRPLGASMVYQDIIEVEEAAPTATPQNAPKPDKPAEKASTASDPRSLPTKPKVNLSLSDLMRKVYEDQPPLQASRRLVEEFGDHHIRIQAQIANMQELPPGTISITLTDGTYLAVCQFTKVWAEHLSQLMPGDNIAVEGTIALTQTHRALSLVECILPGLKP